MFNLVPFAHKVARVHSDYKQIHSKIVTNSLAGVIKRLFIRTDYCHCVKQLEILHQQLQQSYDEISPDRGLEVEVGISQIALPDLMAYIKALLVTVELLQRLCLFHCNKKETGKDCGSDKYRQMVIDYDNSIQEYQRIGLRLNNIFVKY